MVGFFLNQTVNFRIFSEITQKWMKYLTDGGLLRGFLPLDA
jgi:hypothetical protein